jgi:hypothetical protein
MLTLKHGRINKSLMQLLAGARVLLARRLNRWTLGPLVGRIPYTCVRSLVELLYDEEVKKHVVDVRTLSEALIVKYDFPGPFPLTFRREKTFEHRYLYVLRDVSVSPRSGLVWLQEQYILEESVGGLRRIVKGWDGVLHEPLRPLGSLNIQRPVVSCPPTGYFHWLFERMPLVLYALTHMPNAQVLALSASPTYLVSALELLLGPQAFEERVVFCDRPVRIPFLIMPQAEVYSGFVHPADIAQVRSAFKSRLHTTKVAAKELIYISRRRTRTRPLSNERELEENLGAMGFQVVRCEELTFRDQVDVFSRARVLVAPHGAGLSNMVWADRPCSILEIFPYSWINDCYARLAMTLGFNYDYVVCGIYGSRNGEIPLEIVAEKITYVLEKGVRKR